MSNQISSWSHKTSKCGTSSMTKSFVSSYCSSLLTSKVNCKCKLKHYTCLQDSVLKTRINIFKIQISTFFIVKVYRYFPPFLQIHFILAEFNCCIIRWGKIEKLIFNILWQGCAQSDQTAIFPLLSSHCDEGNHDIYWWTRPCAWLVPLIICYVVHQTLSALAILVRQRISQLSLISPVLIRLLTCYMSSLKNEHMSINMTILFFSWYFQRDRLLSTIHNTMEHLPR